MTRANQPPNHRISCHDFAGHHQQVIVFAYYDQVVLVAPPGATAVLTCLQVGALRAALRKAIMDAAQS